MINLKQKREELDISQAKLGELLGVSQQHIQRFEKDNYPIPLKHLPKLAQILHIDIKELLPADFKHVDFSTNPNEIQIEMLDARACCGNGVENFNANVVGLWRMPLEEYRTITTADAANVKMLRVTGDSMEPTLSDGDWVLVDTSQHFVDRDGLFLIRMTSGLAVKRIQNTIGADIIIKSDNVKYNDITAPLVDVAIIGKVIYTLKAEKVG